MNNSAKSFKLEIIEKRIKSSKANVAALEFMAIVIDDFQPLSTSLIFKGAEVEFKINKRISIYVEHKQERLRFQAWDNLKEEELILKYGLQEEFKEFKENLKKFL